MCYKNLEHILKVIFTISLHHEKDFKVTKNKKQQLFDIKNDFSGINLSNIMVNSILNRIM